MTTQPVLLTFAFLLSSGSPATDAPLPEKVSFNRHIRPIMSNICFQCHGPDSEHNPSDLRLDTFEAATSAGAIVPYDVSSSILARRIMRKDPDMQMPPADFRHQLTDRDKALLLRWIEQGAKYEPHWVYTPVVRPRVPTGFPEANNPIDSFILARLQQEGLIPAQLADRRTLIRRLYFDLIGLPPTPEEVDRFINDRSPEAYERLVDSLLASPHFGERLAIYWLDLVRYADTCGIHGDQDITVSPYRDYVIRSFNDNKPFDEFTIQQLAGDLLEEPTVSDIIATGFNRLNLTSHEGGVQDKEYLAKYASDRVRAVSNVWLGATMGCAECHDHKFDPYTMRDFYSLQAFFADVEESGDYSIIARKYGVTQHINTLPTARPPSIMVPPYALVETVEALQKQSDERAKEQLAALEKEYVPTLITKSVEPRTIRILPRGDWLDDSGDVVEPAVPAFFPNQLQISDRRLTRLDLAPWIVSRDNPVTARVFVNRLWKLYFGTGISKVLDDLGNQGEWPVHPELLDWLACEFMDRGWDIKHMIRLMVTSRTYQQSSDMTAILRERDPYNRLLARQSRWRLEAELVRDNVLAFSGLLVRQIGGESVRPYQPEGYWAHLNFPTRTYKASKGKDLYRRGVYTHWQRLFLHPAMLAFDAPSREECTAQRNVSNTPLAALVTLNDPCFVEAARVFAVKVMTHAGDLEARVDYMFEQALNRKPVPEERQVLTQLYESQLNYYREHPDEAAQLVSVGEYPISDSIPADELAAWTQLARTVINLHETITRF